ncbi:hypothetical protein [Shimia biformata]|uniref:hypothetical protein n=1 Tax=Shimia biformata TaxID=1294299 RepID=UPI001950A059|nr:hypothetical protein [Shimia biformata]
MQRAASQLMSRGRPKLPPEPDDRALLLQAELRLQHGISNEPPEESELSKVERVMRRNAPDLAGASDAEIEAAERRRWAHLEARAPRPRLAALVLLIYLAARAPEVTVQFAVIGLFLFLITATLLGPERARDGGLFLWRRFLRLWKHEIAVFRRLIGFPMKIRD